MIPQSQVILEAKEALRTLTLLDQIEELDDVQKVFSNADFPEAALREFSEDV